MVSLRPALSARLAATAVIVLAACAPQSRQHEGAPPVFEADADRDGSISAEEWRQSGERRFDAIDRDGDGQASPEELARSFEAFDADGDGVIDAGEAPTVIALGDADGDVRVTREEFQAIDWTREELDRDRNRRVNRIEFQDARERVFTNADRDRDQRLRRNELEDAGRFSLFRF